MEQDTERLEHVLSNGFTFLAVTTGFYGSWAKARDPITAARNAANANGYGPNGKVAVQVWYGKSGELYCTQGGSASWEGDPPTPIGLFLVTERNIKPMPKGHFDNGHEDHDEWMTSMFEQFAKHETA